jgi:hypothetical protein
MKSYIRRYLDAEKGDGRRYVVVRSSPDQYRRRVPFQRWAKHVVDQRDVLFDFSSREPIRIFLNHNRTDGRNGWYFPDDQGKKVPCDSGYEALFAAYLKENDIPFDYQKWMFARAPIRKKNESRRERMRWWRCNKSLRAKMTEKINIRGSGFLRIPDFYLPVTDEFVELKGWPPIQLQIAAIRYLRRKGYPIRVLEWDNLRLLLGIRLSYSGCVYRAKREATHPAPAFADPSWVKKYLSAPPVHAGQNSEAYSAVCPTSPRVQQSRR